MCGSRHSTRQHLGWRRWVLLCSRHHKVFPHYTPTYFLSVVGPRCCRGGPRSADHVDILGHMDVLADVLTIASGHGHILKDSIVSDVRRIAANIDISEDDCCG